MTRTSRFFSTCCAICALCVLPFAPVSAQSAEGFDEAEIKQLVLEAIRENPEIVREAIAILQERDAAEEAARAEQTLSQRGDELRDDPNAPVLGNLEGDVTLVEFFDYNCGYCRRVFSNVKSLMAGDDNIRLVMREWPILGEESVFAARAALASRAQGKYAEFHNALMSNNGRATQASVMAIATDLGMDAEQLRADMETPEIDAHIALSHQLAQALGINGTPAFVIGDTLVPGAIELEQMQELVAEERG
jgi:protein-disulfide isomerase